jgi:hypothetical protein
MGEALAYIQARQKIIPQLTPLQRTVFVIVGENSRIQIRRMDFSEEFLADISGNRKPRDSLRVVFTAPWDLALVRERRTAIEAFLKLFTGIQSNLDWTRPFNGFMNVTTERPEEVE